MCGSTSGQRNAASAAASAAAQAQAQAQSIFGADSKAYNDLVSSFAPTVAAGPSQYGFSGQEDSNLRSQAITQVGTEYKNEKAAVGNAEAAQGGGTSSLPSGASVGSSLSLAENAGNQTASELSSITQAGYEQGQKNYEEAAEGLEGAGNVFSSSTSATNAATGANQENTTAQNNVAQANESPWSAAIGAATSIGSAATGGLIRNWGNNTNNSGNQG